MIEHHFVVSYNSDTGHYYLCEEDIFLPNGSIYDTSTGRFRNINSDDEDELYEDTAAYGWLSVALNKLSNETTKL